MSARSPIEWTQDTWNPTAGCSVHSPGCTNCYAMRRVAPRLAANPATPHYAGTVKPSKAGPVFTGVVNLAGDAVLTKPLRWKKPRMIFVNSTSDLFHENVPDAWIDRVFAVMALAPQHTFQVLTKRAARMREYLTAKVLADPPGKMYRNNTRMWRIYGELAGTGSARLGQKAEFVLRRMNAISEGEWPLPNVWLGVSAEDQIRADERIPHLLATPAAVRFVSAEPLLGPIDLQQAWHGEDALDAECWGDCAWCDKGYPPLYNCQRGRQAGQELMRGRSGLDWVIGGGESGNDARPTHPAWVRSIRDQCAASEVPFFFKQWGEWIEASEDDLPERFADPRCSEFRCISSCGFIGDLSIGSALQHKPQRYPNCFPKGEAGDATCTAVFVQKIGKKRAGRLLDGVEHNGMPAIREVPAL